MRKRLLFILMTLAIVTASVAAFYRADGEESPRYTTAPVTRGDVVETVEAL